MTAATRALADTLCDGRLVLVHEGGYSDVHVPFCGHATLEALSGLAIAAPDPLAPRLAAQQPDAETTAWLRQRVDALAAAL